MRASPFLGVFLLLASAAAFAQKCPAIDVSMLNKGFSEAAPWRVMSGGPGQCSFTTRNSSVNFGYTHMVASTAQAATAAAVEMRQAVAATSVVEPMPSLGEHGIAYQQRKPDGQVDRASMFFYGHRGTVGVSGYLNLKDPITPAQRDLAANLIAATLGVATNPKALAKETHCRYLDANLVERLLPGDKSTIVPDANNCLVSADGNVITVAVTKDARGWPAAQRLLEEGGCTVDPLPNLGKRAGIAHHCSKGNPRAEVVVVTGTRMIKFLYAPTAEPSADARAALVELARAGARN
ncbi:MAG: hypothetical protein IT518_11825 [Burkholderiales bacterium]|nr:hypothetical protein [Burkholderiales bacterium]